MYKAHFGNKTRKKGRERRYEGKKTLALFATAGVRGRGGSWVAMKEEEKERWKRRRGKKGRGLEENGERMVERWTEEGKMERGREETEKWKERWRGGGREGKSGTVEGRTEREEGKGRKTVEGGRGERGTEEGRGVCMAVGINNIGPVT